MDLDAIFDGKPLAPEPQPQPAEVLPPNPEPPLEAEPEPAPAEQPEPAPTPKPDDRGHMVPLATVLDTRDKLKAAERRIAEFEAQQRPNPAEEAPDPFDDPDGFRAYEASQRESAVIGIRFELSETMARDKHGDDTVQTAMDWGAQRAQTDEAFRIDFLKQRHPIDWVVRQQKRDGLMSEVGDDPDAYVRRRAAELGLIAAPDAGAGSPPVPGQQPAPKPAVPPRSIAGAPSAGGNRDIAMDDKASMDAIFKR